MKRMLARLRCRCNELRSDTRGVAFVEFGLFVPILALMVTAIIDLSQGLSTRFTMQQAVNRSLELLLVRTPAAGANDTDVDYTFIRQEAATAAGVPLTQVALTRYLMCDNARMSSYTGVCADGEETARYVSLRVDKSFTGTFYLGTVALSATGSMRIQ